MMRARYGLLLALVATPAAASDALLVGGGQVSGQNNDYAMAGVITPLPGSHLGDGWTARLFADDLTYRYKAGGRTVDAHAPGAAFSLGYQASGPAGWLGTYAGPAFRDTHLSPPDASNGASGARACARLQLEGEYHLGETMKLDGNGSYDAFADNAFWTRLRALGHVSGTLYAGPEISWQGDNHYRAGSAGLAVTGIALSQRVTLGLAAGVRKSRDDSASPYAGIEFGAAF